MENSPLSPPSLSKTTHIPTVAEKHSSAFSVSHTKQESASRRAALHKIDKESARVAIVAAWPSWAERNLAGRKAQDNDAHAFLRAIRLERPELFSFKSSLSPHEIAFFWLLGAGCVAY